MRPRLSDEMGLRPRAAVRLAWRLGSQVLAEAGARHLRGFSFPGLCVSRGLGVWGLGWQSFRILSGKP